MAGHPFLTNSRTHAVSCTFIFLKSQFPSFYYLSGICLRQALPPADTTFTAASNRPRRHRGCPMPALLPEGGPQSPGSETWGASEKPRAGLSRETTRSCFATMLDVLHSTQAWYCCVCKQLFSYSENHRSFIPSVLSPKRSSSGKGVTVLFLPVRRKINVYDVHVRPGEK